MKSYRKETELIGSACTYTQVVRHVSTKGIIEANKHGGNRDSVIVKILNGNQGIICVTDGAGLFLWSEIASRIASKSFVDFLEEFSKKNLSPSIEEVSATMIQAILFTNQVLINYKDPQSIIDLGVKL